MEDPIVGHGESLGAEFEPVVLSCVLDKDGFYQRFHTAILAEMFVVPAIASMLGVIQEHWNKYGVVPTRTTLQDVIRRSGHRDAGAMIALVQELPVAGADHDYVADRILGWAKWRSIDEVLGDPGLREDPRDFVQRLDSASRVGDELTLNHTKFDEDGQDEEIRAEIMATPWDWLNTRLRGGLEKGDFAVVLTVINGGKTTILVNAAMRHVADGYHGVYFTFEDGEAKIKRRCLQWVNGWTTEEILGDIAEARARRSFFMQQCGGYLHIKDLKSRRSTVDDAISFVRSVEEATGRKVDFVVSDYPDRYGTKSRHNEPRHRLMEIYEDCKFLARELEVVHWGASQVNMKLGGGKDVVGIESGSESTGKFESCDLAVGFGQTMEDEKIGRLTMFTSKVRDARKHEMCSLIAAFDTQRIFEPGDPAMTPKRRIP